MRARLPSSDEHVSATVPDVSEQLEPEEAVVGVDEAGAGAKRSLQRAGPSLFDRNLRVAHEHAKHVLVSPSAIRQSRRDLCAVEERQLRGSFEMSRRAALAVLACLLAEPAAL